MQELIDKLLERRAKVQDKLKRLLEAPTKESRDLTPDEDEKFRKHEDEINSIDKRIKELRDIMERDAKSEAAQREAFSTPRIQVTEPAIYARGNGNSFFRDLFRANNKADKEAYQRLERNNREVHDHKVKAGEARAISTGTGAGGEFVPPLWLEDQFVKFVRPGRITANLCTIGAVPPGTDSINIPKINTGTATAVQGTQNSGVQQTDLTTTSVSSPVQTIAGGQTVSLQLIEQSPLDIDEIVLQDLAADYAKQLNTQVLSGTGSSGQVTGMLVQSGTTSVTWTQATPALGGAGGLYAKIANAIQSIHTSRFLPPTAIIMHPRRWAWAESQSDGNNRPLVVPQAGGPWNVLANMDGQPSQGYAGQILGMPVYLDALLPTTGGAGSNQDTIVVAKMDDIWLWEGQVKAEAFQQTYAQQLSVFVRLYNYVAFQPGRYAQSIATITGTGAVSPTF